MKRQFFTLFLPFALSLIFIPGVSGQQIFQTVQINSSPNPVGSGARAQGMGGAFIAIADDATAASWNPGGLMQLERPEFSFVFNFAHRRKDFDSSSHRESRGLNEIYRDDLNYLSVAFPFMAFDKNMVISLNYQRLYDFYDDLEFNYNYTSTLMGGGFLNAETRTRFRQSGALKAIAPAFAIQITPRFSVGVTFNFWTDNLGYDNGWKIKRETTGKAYIHTPRGNRIAYELHSEYFERNENFEGFNMNLGFLWHVNRVVTIGGVLKTPFTGDVNRKTYTRSSSFPVTIGPRGTPPGFSSRESIEIKFPLSYGLGVAFRLSDEFTIAFDIYRTHWSDFWAKGKGGSTSPITGKPRKESHVKDTTQIRLGGEYLLVLEKTIVPLRFGLFYDPEPSEKNPDDYFGFSLGTGIILWNNVILDCAYIYRWGRDVRGDSTAIPSSKVDVDQHQLYVSMIYHF